MMTWEYKVLPKRMGNVSGNEGRDYSVLNPYTEGELTKLGAQGWEVVSCSFSNESGKVRSALLKRAVGADVWVAKTEMGTIENGLITPGRTEVVKLEGWKAKLAEMLDDLEGSVEHDEAKARMQDLLKEFPDQSTEMVRLGNKLEALGYAVDDDEPEEAQKIITKIRQEFCK